MAATGRGTRRAGRPPLGGLVAVTALACGFGAVAPRPPADIAGLWTYRETIADDLHGWSCTDSGTYTFTQDGSAFSGDYDQDGACATPSGAVTNRGRGSVNHGTVGEVSVEFDTDTLCRYAGVLDRSHAALEGGTAECHAVVNGVALTFRGSWSAERR